MSDSYRRDHQCFLAPGTCGGGPPAMVMAAAAFSTTLAELDAVYRDWLRMHQFQDTAKHRWEFKRLVLLVYVRMAGWTR
jgi:hypothetical protein